MPSVRARIFEMRTYEAPTEKAVRRKMGMFEQGEAAIFRKRRHDYGILRTGRLWAAICPSSATCWPLTAWPRATACGAHSPTIRSGGNCARSLA